MDRGAQFFHIWTDERPLLLRDPVPCHQVAVDYLVPGDLPRRLSDLGLVRVRARNLAVFWDARPTKFRVARGLWSIFDRLPRDFGA